MQLIATSLAFYTWNALFCSFRAYDPADYEHLHVSQEIKELFQYITRCVVIYFSFKAQQQEAGSLKIMEKLTGTSTCIII